MSTTERIEPVIYRHVIWCATRGCGRRHQTGLADRHDNQFAIAQAHGKQMAALGWRVFTSRGRRWYCPEHGPSRGSHAYEVTP